MDTSSIPGLELIQVADVVAREKSIEREEVMLAMEEAIQKAGRAKYGLDRDIRAMIDRKTGAIRLERWIEVVEEVEDESMQMSLAEGAKQNPPLAAGEFWRQSLPPIEFGRIAAQTAKQVISQKVRDAERARQFEEYKHRIGEIVVGTVKRAESYSITVDLGRAEAVIRREEMIPRENLRQGDRVRAYIIDVREEPRGPRFSYRGLVMNLWPSCLRKKCLKSMMALSKSRALPASLAAVPKLPFCQMIRALIRLVLVLVCAVAVFRPLLANYRAKKLKSFLISKTQPLLW